MKVMLVGGGGREHAIAEKLLENPKITELFVLPGNGSMKHIATCVPIEATDIMNVADFAEKEKIDFAIVSPDNPLCMGLVDLIEEKGILTFGPNKAAARIEGSKVFSKNLMKKYGIPTAEYQVFSSAADAKAHVDKSILYPLVIKTDGLAYGKGVVICQNKAEAIKTIEEMMENKVFGASGNEIVVEEFLQGPEVSVLSFTDGNCLKPMLSSMDYKKAYDGNAGPNTGGMGAIAPNPFYTNEIASRCMEEIFLPTMKAMNAEGSRFKGCLYFGLILTQNGPKVIEYNCRFGDPEAQCILPLLQSDLLEIFLAVAMESLEATPVVFEQNLYSCCISICSKGYPVKYETGKELNINKPAEQGLKIFDYGSRITNEGILLTNSGRVLNVVSQGSSYEDARKKAYEGIKYIHFDNMYYRSDIGCL